MIPHWDISMLATKWSHVFGFQISLFNMKTMSSRLLTIKNNEICRQLDQKIWIIQPRFCKWDAFEKHLGHVMTKPHLLIRQLNNSIYHEYEFVENHVSRKLLAQPSVLCLQDPTKLNSLKELWMIQNKLKNGLRISPQTSTILIDTS